MSAAITSVSSQYSCTLSFTSGYSDTVTTRFDLAAPAIVHAVPF
jgi:hypothetical protein